MRFFPLNALAISVVGHSVVIGACFFIAPRNSSESAGAPVFDFSIVDVEQVRQGIETGASAPAVEPVESEAPSTEAPKFVPHEISEIKIAKPQEKKVKVESKPKPALQPAQSLAKKIAPPTDSPSTTAQSGSTFSESPDGAEKPAGVPGNGGSVEARDAYLAIIGAALARHKMYPILARKRSIEGSAKINLQIDRDGTLRSVSLKNSSGSDLLDRAALQMAEDAAPYPRLPETILGRYLDVTVPVYFKLH